MTVRLAKFIADCGVASRRDAEKLIESGRVSVDGIVINTPVFFVDGDEQIVVDGKIIKKNNYETELLVNETIFSSPFDIVKPDKLKRLSKDEIEILNLFYIYGYSYKEISKIKNEKPETIRKRRNRAVSRIRRKDYGI